MPSNKPGSPGSRLIRAAGAVAWRPGPDGEPEILLVHRKKYDDWSLPKGKTEPGEPLPLTAVREVLEEGGARLALGRRLASVRYSVGGRPKRVHYWAARVLSVDERAVPNGEVDEVAWVPAASAVQRVSYVHDHGVLDDFNGRSAGTVPLILLRHSKAVAKGGWKHPDAARPLDDAGRSDAKVLADVLACFSGRPRLITSSAIRCADTLRPLSEVTGAPVREETSLYLHSAAPEEAPADSAAKAAALIRDAIASGEPTVICAHRENLPALQEAALAALVGHPGAETPATRIPGGAIAPLPNEWDDTLPTSGFWVLNVAPLPAPAGQAAPAAAGPAAAEPGDQAAPDPVAARRWWQRPRAGAGRDGAAGPSGPSGRQAVPAGEASAGDTGGDDGTRPVGVLISADRYDLSLP